MASRVAFLALIDVLAGILKIGRAECLARIRHACDRSRGFYRPKPAETGERATMVAEQGE